MSWNAHRIDSMREVKEMFPGGQADELNWVFASTSGVHGSYCTLDDLDQFFADPEGYSEKENGGEPYTPTITLVIVKPRLVTIHGGDVEVRKEDVPYLRGLVSSTLAAVRRSQKGNTR